MTHVREAALSLCVNHNDNCQGAPEFCGGSCGKMVCREHAVSGTLWRQRYCDSCAMDLLIPRNKFELLSLLQHIEEHLLDSGWDHPFVIYRLIYDARFPPV